MAPASFNRLVRFQNDHGSVLYGELSPDFGGDNFVGAQVTVYDGNAPWDDDFVKTSRRETIKTLLSPLAHVPTFVCVGLNYKAHLHEAGVRITSAPKKRSVPTDGCLSAFLSASHTRVSDPLQQTFRQVPFKVPPGTVSSDIVLIPSSFP